MLESLLKPEVLEQRTYEMFFMALAIGAISITLSTIIGRGDEIAHLGVAFCCIAMAPILVRIIQMEEQKDNCERVGPFFGGYWTIIKTYSFYFLGIIVIFSLIFALLPEEYSVDIFSAQVKELKAIRSLGSGRAVSGCGFLCILENNIGVLMLTILFSFVFGAGAIYIITWNASIIGVLIGLAAKEGAGQLTLVQISSALPPVCQSMVDGACAGAGGYSIIISYLIALPCSILALIPHGIFEIGAYFMAGLAGGIVSTISISNSLPDREVLLHTGLLLLGAFLMVVIGALIESV